MKVYYENSDKTKKIDFSGGMYEIADTDIFRHEFQYVAENDKITQFKRGIQTYNIEVNINNTKDDSWQKLYDEMNDIFYCDIISKKRGTLHINGSYIACYIYASEPKEIFEDWGFQTATLKVIADGTGWAEEESKQFLPGTQSESSGGLDFPFDFPFDFSKSESGYEQWNVEHYAPSHFKMIIYGQCVNPVVTINGYPRKVFVTLEESEYLVIDSRDSTVMKYLANGTSENAYNSRQFQPSIFAKIPGGLLNIDWPGTFGMDITLYIERSEPKW